MNHGDAKFFFSRLFKLPNHLWYLLMLVGFYLAYPALRRLSTDRAVTGYLIWLLIGLGSLDMVSGMTGLFDAMAGDNYGFSLWKAFLKNLDNLKVAFVPGYLGLFLLGHYIHEYGLGNWHRRIVCASVPALLLSAILTIWLSMMTGKPVNIFMLETNPLVVLASAGIFAFFRGQGDTAQEDKHSRLTKTMVWLGTNSFGIYLIHLAVRDLLAQVLNLNVASYPAIFSVPLNSILIFLLSLTLTVLLKKIPGIRRIVS